MATLQETYEELIEYSMTGMHATPRSRTDVPPTNGSADGDSMRARRLRPLPVRETIFAWDGKDGNGDTPEAHGAAGQMLADMQVFRAQQGIAPPSLRGDRRSEAAAVYDGVPHRPEYDGQDGARPGWPHQSVGVPGPAQRVMSQAPGAYYGNRRGVAAASHMMASTTTFPVGPGMVMMGSTVRGTATRTRTCSHPSAQSRTVLISV